MSHEEFYLKKQLITFIKKLVYVGGVVPRDKAWRKRLKQLIETHSLMDINTKEEIRVIFGMFSTIFYPLLLLIFLY